MKKIVLSISLALSLFANDNNTTDPANMNPLQLFLFKIGYGALVSDFENEKNKSKDLARRVANIEESIVVLLKKIQDAEVKGSNDEVSISDKYANPEEVKKYIEELKAVSKELKESPAYSFLALREEIANLKAEIERLKATKNNNFRPQRYNSTIDTAHTKFQVNAKKLLVKERASKNSNVIAEIEKGSIIQVEYCDRFDWCKLKDRDGFVARYLLSPVFDENLSKIDK